MSDQDNAAARRLFEAVQRFSRSVTAWSGDAIYHDVKPDEQRDPTLISRRAYGRRDEYLVVLAACGLDTCDQVIPQQTIRLPTEAKLLAIKRAVGCETIADYRGDGGVPTWQ